MCQVTVETGCPQNLADVWWKAGHLKRECGELILRRSRRKGGSALSGGGVAKTRGRGSQPGLWVPWQVRPMKEITRWPSQLGPQS